VRRPAWLAEAGSNISLTNVTWQGCIEERDTVTSITPTSNLTPLPTNAYDLDVNLIPYDDHTRWRPLFPAIVYSRTGGTTTATSGTSMSGSACPAAAVRLAAWNRGNMQSYVNLLNLNDSLLRYYQSVPERVLQEEHYHWWAEFGIKVEF